MTDATQSLAERVRAATAGTRLRLRGGGTKDFYGGVLDGEVLDTRTHAGIVRYDPTELVVTARAGTPLVTLETSLAEQGQMLAFEPPHFARAGAEATVGGCVAAGLSGPRRMAAGAVRDFVLGATLLDGRARVLRFGGEVMKNVAGYDVSRLLAGSLGTLGVILEVSLKVLPRPVEEQTRRFELSQAQALTQLNAWAGQPLPISAAAWHAGVLQLRLSGAAAALRAAAARLGGEAVDAGAARGFWDAVREQTHDFFAGDAPLWRLALPSHAAPRALPGEPFIEWGGALRWLRSDAEPRLLREAAARAGGHATLFRARDKTAVPFAPLSDVQIRLHRGLKAAFDPQGIFNRGRMYPDL
ncbi:MAG TPA: glycolate oxidase subunit GlcE [Burkholderiales bacterium]|nr:glycolate oxidase subunit GlcE [Burkholderiales bacterium]